MCGLLVHSLKEHSWKGHFLFPEMPFSPTCLKVGKLLPFPHFHSSPVYFLVSHFPRHLRSHGEARPSSSLPRAFCLTKKTLEIWNQVGKVVLPYDPTIPLPGIYPEKTILWKDICAPVFTAMLFIIAKTWKQPKCPSTEKWIKNMPWKWKC